MCFENLDLVHPDPVVLAELVEYLNQKESADHYHQTVAVVELAVEHFAEQVGLAALAVDPVVDFVALVIGLAVGLVALVVEQFPGCPAENLNLEKTVAKNSL